jgi:hypothetical protein
LGGRFRHHLIYIRHKALRIRHKALRIRRLKLLVPHRIRKESLPPLVQLRIRKKILQLPVPQFRKVKLQLV